MEEYDEFSGLSRRRYVAPNFAEACTRLPCDMLLYFVARADVRCVRRAPQVRHVLNMAQVRGSAPSLRLITFDADGTLYEARLGCCFPVCICALDAHQRVAFWIASQDGAHFERDNAMIRKITALLAAGLHVGVVTAAGYPGDAQRFEGRLKGLLVRV